MTALSTDEPLRAALVYASRGWRVAWAPRGSKHPAIRRWQDVATADPAVITAWWRQHPGANVCIATGQPSNLLVLDIDDKADPVAGVGSPTLAALEMKHGDLPHTYAVGTGSGGVHYYFTWEGIDFDLRNTAGKLGPGLDTRGDGGQVVAPPSRVQDPAHASPYVVLDAREPVPAPGWLLGLLRPIQAIVPATGNGDDLFPQQGGHGYAATAFRGEIANVLNAQQGCRNTTLNTAAFKLGTLVAAGDLDRGIVTDALIEAARRTGLTAAEIRTTIQSGLAAGELHSRRAI